MVEICTGCKKNCEKINQGQVLVDGVPVLVRGTKPLACNDVPVEKCVTKTMEASLKGSNQC